MKSLLDILGREPPEDELYRLVVQHSPYCIHRIDLQGKLSAMNPAGLVMMGVDSESDVVGTPYLESVHPDERDRIARLLERAYHQEASEFEFRTANGLVFQSNFVPVNDEEGNLISLMGITQDITDRVTAMERLRAGEEQLQLALLAASLDAWELDPESGALEWASTGSGPMTRLFPEKLPGSLQAYAERVSDPDRKAFLATVGVNPATEHFQHRHRVKLDDSTVLTIEWTGRTIRSSEGHPRCLGTVRDLTEQVKLETELVQVQKLEGLGVLSGGIAHDFNNLLAGIMGNLDLVQARMSDDGELAAALADAMTASEHAAELCQQLLAYSGQAPRQEDAVDLSTAVAEMVPLLSASFSRSRPQLELAKETAVVRGSLTQLRQVIMNLITNAADATSESGDTVFVRTRRVDAVRLEPGERLVGDRVPAGEAVLIEVSDNGIGMEESLINRMFDPFFSTKDSGRGLGLSAVVGIVQAHGGVLTVRSAPGTGTRMRVWLPASDANEQAGATAEAPTDLMNGRSRRVLFVDDDAQLRLLAERTLGHYGWEILAAESGVDALAKLDANQDVAVAVIDLTMRGMSGIDLSTELRKRRHAFPIVLTSGYSESDVTNAIENGTANVFLSKPYKARELVRVLGETIQSQ